MRQFLKWLRFTLYWISIGTMGLMLALIFFQVISRYFFGYTFAWSEELARFFFVWVVFVGSALIMGEGGHLAVRQLLCKLEGTLAGLLMEGAVYLGCYSFILLLLLQGGKFTSVMTFQESPAMGLSMSAVYCIIPLSACLMLLYLLRDTLQFVRKINTWRAHGGRPDAACSVPADAVEAAGSVESHPEK